MQLIFTTIFKLQQNINVLQMSTNVMGSYTPPRKTPCGNYISPKNTWLKLHYPNIRGLSKKFVDYLNCAAPFVLGAFAWCR